MSHKHYLSQWRRVGGLSKSQKDLLSLWFLWQHFLEKVFFLSRGRGRASSVASSPSTWSRWRRRRRRRLICQRLRSRRRYRCRRFVSGEDLCDVDGDVDLASDEVNRVAWSSDEIDPANPGTAVRAVKLRLGPATLKKTITREVRGPRTI